MNTPSDLAIGLISSLDIDSFDSVPTGTLVLLNPSTLAPTTSSVTLASAENPLRKKIELAKQRKYRNDVQKTGKIQFSDPAEEIEEETDYLVTSTLGWSLTQAGSPLPFSADAARTLYTDPKKHWVRAQVIAALSKTELFIKDSAKP